MAIGMTYDEFWNGDNEMPKMYRKAHQLKLREANQMAWLQGAYVYNAVGALAPALKAFSKAKPQEYLDSPFPFGEEPVDNGKPAEKPQKQNNEHARAWFEMWAANFNEKFENDDEQNETKGGEISNG